MTHFSKKGETNSGKKVRVAEWAGIEPAESRSQSPVPYHLATILYTGLRISQPHSSFGRLCDLYIIVLCHWQCPNNWTRFSSKRLLNNPTICNPHIGQRQYLTNWITYRPHHQQAVGKGDVYTVIPLTLFDIVSKKEKWTVCSQQNGSQFWELNSQCCKL